MNAIGGAIRSFLLVRCSRVCVGGRNGTDGLQLITPNIRDFSDFIFSLGLVDLPLKGGRFT